FPHTRKGARSQPIYHPSVSVLLSQLIRQRFGPPPFAGCGLVGDTRPLPEVPLQEARGYGANAQNNVNHSISCDNIVLRWRGERSFSVCDHVIFLAFEELPER
ncbi:hypothetical protein BDDG_12418, partial [Blastomyces dermatitidis ATCC 18188]